MSLIHTASASAASAVVFGPPVEGTKITLNETSIDGPALASFPGSKPTSVLAWVGTDHRLYYLTSNDGLHYTNRHMLNEYSLWRPGVMIASDGKGPVIWLDWMGTDAGHTLNLLSIDATDFHLIKKVTLWGETSFTAPAITPGGNGNLTLTWAGTDTQHTLNTLTYNRYGQIISKQVLWGWSSHSRPDVQVDPGIGKTLLSWTGPNLQLNDAQSPDTITWTLLSGKQPVLEWSNWAPSMIGIKAINMPTHWLAWTGLDVGHSLNVMYTENFAIWHDVGSKTILPETALAGPELAYMGVNRQVILAWTGTDPQHHLNVAIIAVKA